MDSSSTSTGAIGTDSVIKSYPERNVILGHGSFGIVFATRLRDSRVAVKICHCGQRGHTEEEKAKLETEVTPLTMSARNGGKHVTSANKAFVHEDFKTDLAYLLNSTSDGTPSGPPPNRAFWRDLQQMLSTIKEGWKNCLVIEMPMEDLSLRGQLKYWGQSLDGDIKAGVCDTNAGAHWFFDLVRGMKELHGADIIHRDLKPENCLLFQEGFGLQVLRISGLGASTFVRSEGQTHTKHMCTLWYRAPELLMSYKYGSRWTFGLLEVSSTSSSLAAQLSSMVLKNRTLT